MRGQRRRVSERKRPRKEKEDGEMQGKEEGRRRTIGWKLRWREGEEGEEKKDKIGYYTHIFSTNVW